MATNVIMPALGLAQETGIVLEWLKAPGESVKKGEPLLQIETDKATLEIEAPATGKLVHVSATAGDEVPVGEVIAMILAAGEVMPEPFEPASPVLSGDTERPEAEATVRPPSVEIARRPAIIASPVAARIAAEHDLDLRLLRPEGGPVKKADVLDYLERQKLSVASEYVTRITAASPKARRLAAERGLDIAALTGSGPGGAVLAADVLDAKTVPTLASEPQTIALSTTWRLMAERTTQSWTGVPHFYLLRDVNASRLVVWRASAQKRTAEKITYTDLLVKLVAITLREHPRLNATWNEGVIILNDEINIGLATAIEEGLVVPVIHRVDELTLTEIAARRKDLVARAQAKQLHPKDIRGGTFTISNLGMYGVDTFNAIINPPQAAILGVGRIAERVVPIDGQPRVSPMMLVSLTCDHRVADGARGAQFLQTLAELIEEPLGLLD